MNINEIRELRQKRAGIYEQMKTLKKTAEDEKRELTAEERNKFDAMGADVDKLKRTIDDEERMLGIAEDLRSQPGQGNPGINPEENPNEERKKDEGKQRAYRDAFRNYLKRGAAGISDEERSLLASEQRDFGTGTAAAGGNLVPAEFNQTLEVALKAYGGMLANAEIIRTQSGSTMAMPSENDTATEGEIIAEREAANEDASTPFGTVSLPVFLYSSKLLPVSFQLLQDSFFDIEAEVIRMIGDRLGRILNNHFTVGTASSQPSGVVTGATLGVTGAAGQTKTVKFDDLVDLVHSVDPAYRVRSKFMASDAMIKVIRKLKDSQERPLWEPSIQAGQPDMLLGYPLVINNDVAAPAASAKSMLFGDFSKYKVRLVQDTTVLRLNERLAEKHQVGFLGFVRAGGVLLDAGTHPVAYYQHPAT